MNELELWKFVLDHLTSGHPVMFIAVVDYKKGSPGKTGFKLAFTDEKTFVGTIGGGVMEYSMMEQYTAQLQNKKTIREVRTLVHSQTTQYGEPSGLQCAGSQTLCAVSLNENDIPTVRSLYTALQEHLPARLILSKNGIEYGNKTNSAHHLFQQIDPFQWIYEENIGPEFTVYIIGGGHVGNALSRIMATLDFHIVLYDERKELQLLSENNYVHKKIIAPYSELGAYITNPQKSYAAIVTSNSNSDTAALQQILPLRLPYVGIMGADAKIARIKKSLSEAELKEYQQQPIHAPIGLNIESRTVEEIAVSIAAEIIAVRNRDLL